MNSKVIRRTYLEFFKSKGHEIVPSSPMVVKNDPTLMFTNAGMNQFKEWFLGNAPAKWPRVADTQKCLRVSGKHNDLEEVGVDTYHHTMFEMLGNWSFGDYFKKEAIEWSWELLTEVYELPKDRLYVTVFEGYDKEGLTFDQEAYDTWKQFVPEERILRGNKKDNFWEMGDTGPCGPCTEIHVDCRTPEERKEISGATLVNNDHPQVIEIWNNVFMEFNRSWKQNGAAGELQKFTQEFQGTEEEKKKAVSQKHLELTQLQPLPAKHVDTGMGFERLVRVIQGKQSNYETDIFLPLIRKIEHISGLRYYEGKAGRSEEVINIAMRVISDHIRAISFSIADGQLPSNTGAGYVIRRILRRAIRYGYQSLGLREPFMFELVAVLANQMGEQFPELLTQKELIEKVIKEEETSFYRTLDSGLKRIDSVCIELSTKHKDVKVIDGKTVFELYDTFGFPLDLTALIAKGYELSIDEEGFKVELEKQKNRSRAATAIDTDDWVELIKDGSTKFVGYDQTECDAKILRYRRVKAKGKELYQVVLDETPFYAESGGQVGDTGVLESANEKMRILDTKKENGVTIHLTDRLPEDIIHVFRASVDVIRRKSTENNHSATHLLHAALRQVLGPHVEQKGSLVNDEHLRFDFSHFAKISEEDLAKIEKMVNEKIRENIESNIREMAIDDARTLGAMALFGEKYGDVVRVVTFDKNYSIELCGGTHVTATGQIGLFKITSESAVAAGIRRIEAITSVSAEKFINDQLNTLHQVKELLKAPKDVLKSIHQLLDEKSALEKQVQFMLNEKVKVLKADLIGKVENRNGLNFISAQVELNSAEAIKNLAYEIREKVDNLFLVLGAEVNGKASLTLMLSDNLVKDKNLNASTIIRELSKEIQGGGGGQAFFATSGGTNVGGIAKALEKAKEYVN